MLRVLLPLLLAVPVASCTSFHNVHLRDVPTTIQVDDSVRVTTMKGVEHRFRVSAVDQESVSSPVQRFVLTDLVMVERQRFHWLRSFGAFILAGAALLALQES